VGFVARGETLRAIRERGLRVTSPDGNFTIDPARVSADPAELGLADGILLGVKTWQVTEAAHAIRPALGADSFVVPLQNGVEAPDQLADILGAERVVGGLCRIIARIVDPGVIRHEGAAPYVGFGELDGRMSARVARLQAAFARARGLTAEALSDIQGALWRKFLFIASVSGIGAVTRAPIGVLRQRAETRELLERAMWEVRAVAVARGVPLPEAAVAETMAFTDTLPEDGTTSMQRDIMAGRPSELEAQSGAVVRLGRNVRVETPVHEFIYRSLVPLELRARGELAFRVE
jgi:2-dehydropantoate 2-reductase